MKRTITTGEIAEIMEVSEKTVARNEGKLGFDRCRCDTRTRVRRYRRRDVLILLRGHGYDVPTVPTV